MTKHLRILMAMLLLAGIAHAPAAQAAGVSKGERQAQMLPSKPPTCKKSWPYVVLICVA